MLEVKKVMCDLVGAMASLMPSVQAPIASIDAVRFLSRTATSLHDSMAEKSSANDDNKSDVAGQPDT